MVIDVYNKTTDIVSRGGVRILPKKHRRVDNLTRSQYKEIKACSKLVIQVVKKAEAPVTEEEKKIIQNTEGFTCPYCGASFKKKSRLTKHIEINHKDKMDEEEGENVDG